MVRLLIRVLPITASRPRIRLLAGEGGRTLKLRRSLRFNQTNMAPFSFRNKGLFEPCRTLFKSLTELHITPPFGLNPGWTVVIRRGAIGSVRFAATSGDGRRYSDLASLTPHDLPTDQKFGHETFLLSVGGLLPVGIYTVG